jgi:TonB family protein
VAGAIEVPPLRFAALQQANQATLERFTSGVTNLFTRYLRLGIALTMALIARYTTQVQRSEARHRQLIEQATDGIFVSDQAGNFLDVNPAAAPVQAPSEIKPETGIEAPEGGVSGGVEGGVPGGVVGGVVGGLPEAPPPPPPPVAPVRVGGNIRPPTKIKNVNPVYPSIAQSARVQGVVIVEATIGPDGKVSDARVLRSIPLLDQAALDAVRQWVFTPTLLNGVPVPVIMTVTVNFTLQ